MKPLLHTTTLLLLLCSQLSLAQEDRPRGGKTRTDVLIALEQAAISFRQDQSTTEIRLAYGRLLFESGDFWQAREVILPLMDAVSPSIATVEMAAKLQYLTGHYEDAVSLYDQLREAKSGDVSGQVAANVNKLLSYYQQNRFDRINQIQFPPGIQLPNAAVAAAFTENPYRIEWHTDARISVAPFHITDPLPVITVEVDGIPVQMLFDTGGDMFILDSEIALRMGIRPITTAMGTFGGGLRQEISFGKAETVKIGDVTIHTVPLTILPTKRFSQGFGGYTIGGIIGTAAMRQFLGSLDYAREQLVLRERSPENNRRLRADMGERLTAEIPFVLDQTHLMMARGSLNDKEELTFFIDSGLASQNMVTVPIQTLEYLDIEEPEVRIREGTVGGGGGLWASGQFSIKQVGLGPLIQHTATGEYGSRTPNSYWTEFYIQDGLLSHQFLRQYASWTIDFDNMTYLFEVRD
ncbi:MAG: hypothetical protein CL484_03690 [Acidobacteria bacterium]|nr:hypothetical protein [Acidobacteriota bacterium]